MNLTRAFTFASLLLAPLVRLHAADAPPPAVHTVSPQLQPKIQFLNPQYLVYAPSGKTDAKLPLLIFLHGAGEVGNEIDRMKGKPTAIWEGIQKFNKGPCIVVAPQCLKKSTSGERGIWTPEDLNLLLQHLKATLPVDDRRIYLSDISMGGYGTWAWASHDPQHFAAVAPIVGGIGGEDRRMLRLILINGPRIWRGFPSTPSSEPWTKPFHPNARNA